MTDKQIEQEIKMTLQRIETKIDAMLLAVKAR